MKVPAKMCTGKTVAKEVKVVRKAVSGSKFNRPEEAVKYFESALACDPHNEVNRNNLAHVLVKLGRHEEALGHFQQCRGLAQAHNGRGQVLFNHLKRSPEAEDAYREALRMDPDYSLARNNLAVLLGRTNRRPEAVKEYTKAIELDPNSKTAHLNLGVLLGDHMNDTKGAERHLNAALRLDHSCAPAHAALGRVFVSINRHVEARKSFEKALGLNPGLLQARKHLAELLAGPLQEPLLATAHYRQLLHDDPTNSRMAAALGELLLGPLKGERGAHLEGLRWLREAVATDQNDMRSRLVLANALCEGVHEVQKEGQTVSKQQRPKTRCRASPLKRRQNSCRPRTAPAQTGLVAEVNLVPSSDAANVTNAPNRALQSIQEARDLYEQATRIGKCPQAHYNLGWLYSGSLLCAPAKAEAAYRAAIREEAHHAEAQYSLALLLQAQPGQDEDAEREYVRLLQHHPNHVEGKSQLSVLRKSRQHSGVTRAQPTSVRLHGATRPGTSHVRTTAPKIRPTGFAAKGRGTRAAARPDTAHAEVRGARVQGVGSKRGVAVGGWL